MNGFGSSLWMMLVLIIAFFQLNFLFSSSLNDEGIALMKFRERVVNDPFQVLSNWNEADRENKPCSWFGIECVDGHVVSLDLRNSCLEGTLAPELGNILHLKSIVLRNNSFFGAIPEEIRNLKELKLLDLGYNKFTWPLLPEFEGFTILLLDNNGLSSEPCIPQGREHIMLSEAQMDGNHLSCSSQPLPYNRHKGWGKSAVSLRMLQEAPPIERSSSSSPKTGVDKSLPDFETPSLPSSAGEPELPLPPIPIAPPPRKPSHSSGLPSPEVPSPLPPPPVAPPVTFPPSNALPPPNLPSVPHRRAGKNKALVPALGAVGGFIALVLAIGAICVWKIKKRTKITTGSNGQQQRAFIAGNGRSDGLHGTKPSFIQGILNLTRSELETACEDFSNVIGSSSIGTVYKGTLSNGIEIAVVFFPVTSTKEWSHQLQIQFRKKIETLSKVNHKNFVKLMGYCEEENPFTRMMVFEYPPNGTLFEHLHVQEAEHLDWGMRLKVIMGITYCLEHMHQLVPPITHPNFNSSAVSLAEDYAAKISDFSLWNQVAGAQFQPSITAILTSSSATLPSNVYSFGLVLMEIMTGRVPLSSENNSLLEDWVSDYLGGERPLQEWVDPMLRFYNPDQLENISEVIRKCLEIDPQRRLTMRDVMVKLYEITGIDRDKAGPRLSPLWWEEVDALSLA